MSCGISEVVKYKSWSRGNIAQHEWGIDCWKVEVTPFVIRILGINQDIKTDGWIRKVICDLIEIIRSLY